MSVSTDKWKKRAEGSQPTTSTTICPQVSTPETGTRTELEPVHHPQETCFRKHASGNMLINYACQGKKALLALLTAENLPHRDEINRTICYEHELHSHILATTPTTRLSPSKLNMPARYISPHVRATSTHESETNVSPSPPTATAGMATT